MTEIKTSDFYFDLPPELIAQTPLKNRSESRLLTLDKNTGAIEHGTFRDILNSINEGDCLVLNETRVIPARLFGTRNGTGAKVELLILNRKDDFRFETLVNPGKKAKVGDVITFGNGELTATIEDIIEGGNRIVKFDFDGVFEAVLDKLGEMPLPPYIKEKLEERERYQTVYAKNDGSAAAPTAGLHFTKEVLQEIADKKVKIAKITLHVGLGTFRPVKVENVLEHTMHSEFYQIDESQANIINEAKANGGKIIAVGTTTCRTLESSALDGKVVAGSGWTDIFIYPSYKFKIVDSLITNFHLPESTLIMLVSALAGKENVLHAYNEAVKEKYRFFSFGDCCLVK